MEKYKDMTVKKRSNLKMLRNLCFFITLIILTFYLIFKDQDITKMIETMKTAKIIYIIIGAFFMLLVYLMESYNIRSILVALGEKKISLIKALKFTWIGFFFSAITPAATGGQPVEVYYMTKENIKTSNGTMTMLLQLCGFQISTLTISIICAILYPSILKDGIIWFYLLGILLNGTALFFMLTAIFSKTVTKKLIDLLIKILKIIKIKNLDIKKKKIEEGLTQYNESAEFILSHKIEFIKSIARVFVQIIFYHSIPYFVYRAFGLTTHTFLEVFAMQAVLYTTVSSLPLPGAIGVSETLFLKIFTEIFSKKFVNGAMLIYRLISFYFYIIVSATVVIINAIKTKNINGEIDKNIEEIDSIDTNNKIIQLKKQESI